MGYVGASLRDCFEPEPTHRALHNMAETGGDALDEYAVRNTPIDTGNLRTSWYTTPVRSGPQQGVMTYEVEVATDVEYAAHVEHGTGLWGPRRAKYLIVPRNARALSWMTRGADGWANGRVFAARVWHPGSPGAHMMGSAAAKVEAMYARILHRPLRQWVRESEAQMRAANIK